MLDAGDWSAAQMLLPGPDHLGRPEFGGEAVAMAEIARYRRALKDLRKQHGGVEKDEEEQTYAGQAENGGRRRGAKGKGKDDKAPAGK